MENSIQSSAPSSRSLPGNAGAGHCAHRLGGWAGAGLMASTLLVLCPAARAEGLQSWQFDPATQQLTFTLPSGVTPQYTLEHDPDRLVLILPQTQMGAVATEAAYSGAVNQVRLSQVNGDTVVVLDLAPNTVLVGEGASLVALAAGDQTRWMLTALVAGAPSLATSPTTIVELPIIPGNDPSLGFPAAGTGRLSTSAANLMLPSDVNSLTNLPETLPVDPFNLGAPGQQVSVPSLAELDAQVGPVITTAQGSAAAPIAAAEPSAPAPGSNTVIAIEPPALSLGSPGAIAAAPNPVAAPTPNSADLPPIDSETSGLPIAVLPPTETALEPVGSGVTAPAAPEPAAAIAPEATAPADPIPALPTPTIPAVDPTAIASEPPPIPTAEGSEPVAAIAAAPLPSLEPVPAPSPGSVPTNEPGPTNAIVQEPPAIATLPVTADPNLLTVPTAPNTASQGQIIPPAEPVILAAAGEPILFGSPLPNSQLQAAYPDAVEPAPADRPLSPDTLIAAGTVLELQYVGNEPLDLNTSSTQNQVLLLANDIRDPITNGIVAPAGSQLIGQFEPSPSGQRWVSKQLISPSGEQVAFATTTDYLVGSPEVSPPRLAAGAGLGALALLLVTGFSGIGLVGGALIGATTVVGTSPQHIVVEPNQIIQVQVLQDVPRAIPIAAASEYSREWGIGGW